MLFNNRVEDRLELNSRLRRAASHLLTLCGWVLRGCVQVVGDAVTHAAAWGTWAAYWGAVPFVIFIASARRGASLHDVISTIKLPFGQ